MRKHIGIYSGTFDPIHPGHVAFALEAQAVCTMHEVIFLPERRPRGKSTATPIHHRIALLQRALRGTSGLRIAELSSARFTVGTTLPEIRQLCGEADLSLLIGSDIVPTLRYWNELDTLLDNVSFAVGMRASDQQTDIEAIFQALEADYKRSIGRTYIHTSEADLASTSVRAGGPARARLHPATRAYIAQHGLYA